MTKENTFIPPCEKCKETCCDYVAIEIDKPTTKTDYDHIRWYLVHYHVNVFVDHDRKWYVEFRTGCAWQDKKNKCTIYENRPKICRDYGEEEGECHYFDSPYTYYFTNEIQFEEYLEKRGIDWKYKRLK